MNKKRIVITGVGVLSPLGMGKDVYWNALQNGKSGIKPITLFDTSGFKVNLGGEISDFRPKEIFDKKKIIDFDRSTTLLLASAQSALEDAQ